MFDPVLEHLADLPLADTPLRPPGMLAISRSLIMDHDRHAVDEWVLDHGGQIVGESAPLVRVIAPGETGVPPGLGEQFYALPPSAFTDLSGKDDDDQYDDD